MTRPGASEVYKILVPCALTPRGKHEISIRLRTSDNRVTFGGGCDRRTASAHDVLTPTGFVTDFSCRSWLQNMHDAIRWRNIGGTDLLRCRTCDAIVPAWKNDCPFQIYDPDDGPTHFIDRRANLAFWDRLVRSGRVR